MSTILEIASVIAQAPEATLTTLIPQVGLGGAFLLIFARFLARIEVIFTTRMDNIEHAQRGLAKAVWMLLAEISTAGSFVREEAKRMIARDAARDAERTDEARRNGRS